MTQIFAGLACFLLASQAISQVTEKTRVIWVAVPAGSYLPLMVPSQNDPKGLVGLKQNSRTRPGKIPVAAFFLQKDPVTDHDFFNFLIRQSQWGKGKIKSLFAEVGYLRHWPVDFPASAVAKRPVVNISWFAAKAYCQWIGGRLPSTDEWEYVASLDRDLGRDQVILNWYARSSQSEMPPVGRTFTGKLGVRDMHGLIWEWTEDFNSAMVTGESREDGSPSSGLFCGAGAIGATRPEEYATFMREAFRGSLKARYVLPNLGFRCAKGVA